MKARVNIVEKEFAELKRKLKGKEEDEASSTAPPEIKFENEVPWLQFWLDIFNCFFCDFGREVCEKL